jgi:hypothetical protein
MCSKSNSGIRNHPQTLALVEPKVVARIDKPHEVVGTDMLRRWSHSAVSFDDRVLIFGGFGIDSAVALDRKTPDQRLDSVAVWQNHQLQSLSTSTPRPVPRERHTAVRCGSTNQMAVFGGRTNPYTALDDCWLFDADQSLWTPLQFDGAPRPAGRYRHAACWTHRGLLIHGGCTSLADYSSEADKNDDDRVCDDMWLLEHDVVQNRWQWRQLNCSGQQPTARHSHTLSTVGNTVYLFGGFERGGVWSNPSDTALYSFNVDSCEWQIVDCVGTKPASRYSASAVSVDDRYLIMVGGCSVDDPQFNQMSVFDTEQRRWHRPAIALPAVMLCKHAVAIVQNQLLIMGGGALCFSFGACFNDVVALNIIRGDHLEFELQPSAVHQSEPLVTPVVPAVVESTLDAAVENGIPCRVCGVQFASRNKLNRHLVESNHRNA